MSPGDADRVIILDRDGTLVFDRHYLSDPAGLEFLPGAAEGLRSMYASGYRLVVITNQSGIGRGMFSLEAMQQMNVRLMQMVDEIGAHLERIYVCPHRPEDHCDCRKPRPRLLLDAAAELGFAPARAVVIGDKQSDIEFGAAVGAMTMLVSERATTAAEATSNVTADVVVRNLSEAAIALQGRF
ncbi:MAG TPA: HAD family hydrolase [Steroidobacteraceae bacterium]|nr:HAD family hydrolase [Steroidobacteraceae bacterium]